jgi:hypothetical protein
MLPTHHISLWLMNFFISLGVRVCGLGSSIHDD